MYGPVGSSPLAEYASTRPNSVYGKTKLAAERVAREFGDWVRIARPFNHSGAEQSARYVLPALARAALRQLEQGGPARTGNLWPRRDFLHVDDVLDAYELLLEAEALSGPVNVCRGRATEIADLLQGLQQRLGAPVRNAPDPDLVRQGETKILFGDNRRLRGLGWRPRVELSRLLDEVARAAKAEAAESSGKQ